MDPALRTAASGMAAQQLRTEVIANNLANVNTTGFKASTTVFSDTLRQMLTSASGGNADRGGTNPIQIGLGVQLAATMLNFNQGSAQTTGRPTDLMLQGDGFFVLRGLDVDAHTREENIIT